MMDSKTDTEKLEILDDILVDIRQLKQVLVAKDVGVLTEIQILFIGDSEPTVIKINPPNVGLK